jgi:hypothetical protein
MRNSKTSSKASSAPSGRNSNALAVLDLAGIASDMSANEDNPDFVRAKAEELRLIAEQAFDVLEKSDGVLFQLLVAQHTLIITYSR